MLRLTDEQWERIKHHFPEENLPAGRRGRKPKGGGDEIGKSKSGKGLKIMAIVDRHGLPLSVSTHAANHHEVNLVQLSFDFLHGRSHAGQADW